LQSVGEATKSVVFFRLGAKSGEQIAAFDGVGGVLGDLEQFGEFRPVSAASEEGVDKRGCDDAEALQALLFPEGLVVSGLLFREIGVALFKSGEENGVFLAQNGVFVLQNGVLLAQRLGFSLYGGKLLVSPVQRLIAELAGFSFGALGVKQGLPSRAHRARR
jgi:hypothetical protein